MGRTGTGGGEGREKGGRKGREKGREVASWLFEGMHGRPCIRWQTAPRLCRSDRESAVAESETTSSICGTDSAEELPHRQNKRAYRTVLKRQNIY